MSSRQPKVLNGLVCAVALLLTNLQAFADDKSLPAETPAEAVETDRRLELTNSIGMKLRLIRAGNYLMGAPDTDREAFPKERPQHRVWITKAYYLGKFEVTRREFQKFIDATGYRTLADTESIGGGGFTGNRQNPYTWGPQFTWKHDGRPYHENYPVTNVAWLDAVQFCQWLSKAEGKQYRLPTEAEWEWACRGGATIERWSSGDDPNSLQGHANILDAAAKVEAGPMVQRQVHWNDGEPFVSEVGKYKPNPFGLYDMHGNVTEWCQDWFDETYYKRSPIKNPRGPVSGSRRVVRGGNWYLPAFDARSSCRGGGDPRGARHFNLGFRVALEISEEKSGGEKSSQ